MGQGFREVLQHMEETYLASRPARALSRRMSLVGMFAALLCVLSFVVIPLPFSPVPLSGQTLGVMLSGGLLSPADAVGAVGLYLALGAVGLPVFAGGRSGLGTLFGPSGGYLWGFIPGTLVISALVGKRCAAAGHRRVLAALILGGILVVDAFGLLQLRVVMGISWYQAAAIGLVPFLPGDLLKAMLAAFIIERHSIRRLMER